MSRRSGLFENEAYKKYLTFRLCCGIITAQVLNSYIRRCTMMKKMILGVAVCFGVSGVNGVEPIYEEEARSPSTRHMSESNSSFGEVSKTPGNLSDSDIAGS